MDRGNLGLDVCGVCVHEYIYMCVYVCMWMCVYLCVLDMLLTLHHSNGLQKANVRWWL